MMFGCSSTLNFLSLFLSLMYLMIDIIKQLEGESKIVLIVLHLQQVIQISPSSKAEQITVLPVNNFVGSRFEGP